MKNRDILLDVIGDTDETLIPELSEKKKRGPAVKWTAVGGVCAAALIAFVVFLSGGKNDKISTLPQTGGDDNMMILAAAAYPEMPMYPSESDQNAYEKWHEAKLALRNQPKGYKDGFDTFFLNSTQTFLTQTQTDNKVYSPLSLYMALGMSAEISGGNTRQQILDVLAQDNIKALRSHAKSIWQANYMDDGMAKCILSNSLWTNSNTAYTAKTIDLLANNYYASVFSGDPKSDAYNQLMQKWIADQTDGLLSDYASTIKMDPEMVLTLASTVNYSGKWNIPFSEELTQSGTFHSPSGDVQCDFMNSERDTTYFWGEKFASITMSLENNGQMRLILPDEGVRPEELLCDDEAIRYMISTEGGKNSKYVIVNLSVPKFDISSTIDLKDGLKKMGVTDAFDSSESDFSPLSESADMIVLSKAEQNTRVMIDEEGCKAASLTTMLYAGSAMPDDYVAFTLDRPFLFEIMSETGLPLFVGIINQPTR